MGRSKLIDFSQIEKNLEHIHQRNIGVKQIPINKIVGSLGRYQDFSKGFLPSREWVSEKYAGIKEALECGIILPPIKVYQILDNYFVIDGHHRVMASKNELNAPDIDAEVIKIDFDIKLSSNRKYDYNTEEAKKFLIKLEEEIFERETYLSNEILKYPLKVTDLTSYAKLYEEILEFQKLFRKGEISRKHIIFASYLWYEYRYLPVVKIILKENFLEGFKKRTYTDLYLWMQQHKYYLSQKAGRDVGIDFTKEDFRERYIRSNIFTFVPPMFKSALKRIKKEIKKYR